MIDLKGSFIARVRDAKAWTVLGLINPTLAATYVAQAVETMCYVLLEAEGEPPTQRNVEHWLRAIKLGPYTVATRAAATGLISFEEAHSLVQRSLRLYDHVVGCKASLGDEGVRLGESHLWVRKTDA